MVHMPLVKLEVFMSPYKVRDAAPNLIKGKKAL